ncbi:MAG: pyrroloquinoline quinone precursor peptide PqqA [Streptomyces sp.]|nr:pyrroloquinoline quinone precursor peptide PqqA [Streptomyces sp.]
MNETLRHALRTDQPLPEERETSDENVWQSPGYAVVEAALEVTAYALADR